MDPNSIQPQPNPEEIPPEPPFNLKHGLKILLIVGAIVIAISMICIGFWPSSP
jgi:hypothetical protein